MRKNCLKVILLPLIFSCHFLRAQEISGTAYYNVKTVIKDIKIPSDIKNDYKKSIRRQYAQGIEEEFILDFTNNESVYRPKTIDENQIKYKEGEVYLKSEQQNKLYRNFDSKQVVFESKLLGISVLVQDSIYHWDWKMENETKKIGEYECKKATRAFEPHKHSESSDKTNKEVIPHVVTVWYTPAISVPHGPGIYQGLPGLILQVEDGNRTIKLTKLKMNKKAREIKKPSKGRLIARKDFDEINKESCNCN